MWIRTQGLPDGSHQEKTYWFSVSPAGVSIKEDWATDAPAAPDCPEQAEWLDRLELPMRRTLECDWAFDSPDAMDRLVAVLGPFVVPGT
jgi:hypothetical protein